MNANNDVNNAPHLMQSQGHYDNDHGNGDNRPSPNAEPAGSKSFNPNSSETHGREAFDSATSTSTSSTTGISTPTGSHPQPSRKHSYPLTNDPNNNQSQSTNIDKSQFLLEQIKLTQLHHLQQLQNHIFQQQVFPASLSVKFFSLILHVRWRSSAVSQPQ
jgi:hypothetical protein